MNVLKFVSYFLFSILCFNFIWVCQMKANFNLKLILVVWIVTDHVDCTVSGAGFGDSRRDHPRSALHQAIPPALLSHRWQQLPNVSIGHTEHIRKTWTKSHSPFEWEMKIYRPWVTHPGVPGALQSVHSHVNKWLTFLIIMLHRPIKDVFQVWILLCHHKLNFKSGAKNTL